MGEERQQVPHDEAIMVEFPGIVRDVDAALAMLGGQAAAALRHPAAGYLQLRFRPSDPTSHPLVADRQPARGLLLRISRRSTSAAENTTGGPEGLAQAPGAGPSARAGVDGERGAGAAEAGAGVKARVVARVPFAYRFTGLADFQYVPHDGRSAEERVRRAGPSFLSSKACLLMAAHITSHQPGRRRHRLASSHRQGRSACAAAATTFRLFCCNSRRHNCLLHVGRLALHGPATALQMTVLSLRAR